MANDYADKELPRAKDQIAPAIYDENKEEWVVVRGRDGRMWVRDDSVESQLKELNKAVNGNSDKTQKVEITNDTQKARPVDGNGNSLFTQDRPGSVSDTDVLSKLGEQLDKQNDIIDKQQKLIDRLNEPIDTQLSGRIVEQEIPFDDVEPGKSQEIKLAPEKPMQVLVINEFRSKVGTEQGNEGWSKIQFFLGSRKDQERNRLIDVHGGKDRNYLAIYPGSTPWNPVVKIPDFGMIDGEYTQDWYRFLRTLYFSEESPLIIRLNNKSNDTLEIIDNLKLVLKEL